MPLILGTSTFASRFVTDPFFAPGASGQTSSTLSPQLIDEQTLPATTGQLEMSPSGASWAIRRFEFSNDGTPPVNTMIVGSERGIRHEYPADDLVLLDDTRLLALFREEGHPTVEQRPHDPAAPAHWRADLEPLLEGAQLSANPATGQWRVTGIQGETGAFVRVSGEAEGSFTVDRWGPGSEGAVWVVGDGPAALGIASHFDETAEELLETELDDDAPSLWWVLAGYTGMGLGARVLSLDADGARELYESQLHVQCDAPRPGETQPLCRANDGKRTTLWRVDPASGQARFVARIDGFTWPARPQSGGWLLLVNAGTRQRLHLLHDERLDQLDVGDTPPWIQAVAAFDGGVGVVVSDTGARALLRRYRLR